MTICQQACNESYRQTQSQCNLTRREKKRKAHKLNQAFATVEKRPKLKFVFLYDNTASPNADFLQVRGYRSDNNVKVECYNCSKPEIYQNYINRTI